MPSFSFHVHIYELFRSPYFYSLNGSSEYIAHVESETDFLFEPVAARLKLWRASHNFFQRNAIKS